MALMKRLQKSAVDITPIDITHNLESLQFESALDDAEKQLLVLRKRSHALTVTACAQATFVANILHEARCPAIYLRSLFANQSVIYFFYYSNEKF